MKRILFASIIICAAQFAFGQTIQDALRYSYLQPTGSARYLGAGGAFGALGADYGSLSSNPAGLAMYRTDDIVFSPALRFANTNSTLQGNSTALEESKTNFNVGSFGFVFNTEPNSQHWKAFNVGIGMNKMANFNNAVYYSGDGQGTIMNGWYSDAASILNNGGSTDDFDPFTSGLAYDANALYEQDGNFTYDFAGAETANIRRSQSVITSGKMNEMVLSFAGNYDEKLMIGATIGVPFVSYRLDATYEESDVTDAVPYFDNLTYTEYLRTNGIGVNLKMGVIYKINQMFRMGAAIHTPTMLGLTDNFSNTLQYGYTDGSGSKPGELLNAPDGTFDYRLRTPWRAMIGASAVIKKYGFLSADVEVVDYSASKFNLTSNVSNSSTQSSERDLNNAVIKAYQQAINIRLGGEAAIGKFRLRAGTNLLGKAGEGKTGFNTAVTGGIGVRGDAFYVDLGVRHSVGSSQIIPYNDPTVAADKQAIADVKTTVNDVLLTIGFKF